MVLIEMKKINCEYYNYINSLPRLSQNEIEELYASEDLPYSNLELEIRQLEDEISKDLNNDELKKELEILKKKQNDFSFRYLLTVIGRKNKIRRYPSLELRNKIVLGTLYIPLIYAKIYFKKKEVELDFDDLFQIATEALMSAVKYYVPGGEAKFETYASTCIKNKLNKEIFKSKKKKNKSKVKNFFQDEKVLIEEIKMFLSAVNSMENGNRNSEKTVINRLNVKIRENNKYREKREEKNRQLRKVNDKTLDEILMRYSILISKSKLNVLITAEEKRDVDDYLKYLGYGGKTLNYLKVSKYLEIYLYKLDMLEKFFSVKKSFQDSDIEDSDLSVLQAINDLIKEINQKIFELRNCGFFDNFELEYKELYDFYNEYYEIYGIDLLGEDEDSRIYEKEKILDYYNWEIKDAINHVKQKMKVISTSEVVLGITAEEEIVEVFPYIPFEQVNSNNEYNNEFDYYTSLAYYDFTKYEILSYDEALKRINAMGDASQYLSKILKERAALVNRSLREKNAPIIKANRDMREKEDLYNLGKKYHKYLKQRDLENIKENFYLLYNNDPELVDLLLERDRTKRRRENVEEEVLDNLFLEDYCRALESLSELERKIMLMYYDELGYNKMTTKGIANELGVTPSKVKYERAKALRKLRNNKILLSYLEE